MLFTELSTWKLGKARFTVAHATLILPPCVFILCNEWNKDRKGGWTAVGGVACDQLKAELILHFLTFEHLTLQPKHYFNILWLVDTIS